MWEFEVQHLVTGEHFIIHGYNFLDACARSNISMEEVMLLYQEYVD